MLIIKILMLFICFSCNANNLNIVELSDDKKDSLSPYPDDMSFRSIQFENIILYSNESNFSTSIEYFYSCDGLPLTKDLDHYTLINDKNVGNSHTIVSNGVVIKVDYKSNRKIRDKELNRLYLISHAKYYALNLSSARNKEIDYVQWCILKENKYFLFSGTPIVFYRYM